MDGLFALDLATSLLLSSIMMRTREASCVYEHYGHGQGGCLLDGAEYRFTSIPMREIFAMIFTAEKSRVFGTWSVWEPAVKQ